MLIRSNFPIDETFLSSVVNEGILCYLEYESVVKAIERLKKRLISLKDHLGRDFEKLISIRLTGNDLTDIDKFQVKISGNLQKFLKKIGLENFADIKSLSEHIERNYGVKGKSEKDIIKTFILQNISKADLEEVENFYTIFIENYDSSGNWLVNDSQILEKYLSFNLGTKIVCLGKIKREFEPFIKNSNKFEKFRQNFLKRLNNRLKNADLETLFENVLPCIFPVYMRLGFPEQLLEKILPDYYTKERIFKMILEKKEKGSGESTYNDIIALFMRISEFDVNVKFDGNINVEIDDKKKNIYIRSERSNDLITAPQILKCDRYTGFSTFEENYFTDQFTLYISQEVALICIIGLTNSLVLRVYDSSKRQDFYYFLFFSPEEVSKLYFNYFERRDIETIRKYHIIKDEATKILREIYQRVSSNEVAITELALNLKFQELLSRHNLDKISFTLFKIALEGNTYKIYEQIPIRVYRKIAFAEVVERYFRNSDDFVKRLSEIFDKSKNRRLWDALKNKDSPNYPEGDNVLKAMQGLYRFVILGDLQGYYQFVREIFNCYRIYERPKNREEEKIRDYYRSILERLGWF